MINLQSEFTQSEKYIEGFAAFHSSNFLKMDPFSNFPKINYITFLDFHKNINVMILRIM